MSAADLMLIPQVVGKAGGWLRVEVACPSGKSRTEAVLPVHMACFLPVLLVTRWTGMTRLPDGSQGFHRSAQCTGIQCETRTHNRVELSVTTRCPVTDQRGMSYCC